MRKLPRLTLRHGISIVYKPYLFASSVLRIADLLRRGLHAISTASCHGKDTSFPEPCAAKPYFFQYRYAASQRSSPSNFPAHSCLCLKERAAKDFVSLPCNLSTCPHVSARTVNILRCLGYAGGKVLADLLKRDAPPFVSLPTSPLTPSLFHCNDVGCSAASHLWGFQCPSFYPKPLFIRRRSAAHARRPNG